MNKRYSYGELRVDLTPLDIYLAGFTMRRHIDGVSWCWWRKSALGTGAEFGPPYATPEEAHANARWRMTGIDAAAQPLLRECCSIFA